MNCASNDVSSLNDDPVEEVVECHHGVDPVEDNVQCHHGQYGQWRCPKRGEQKGVMIMIQYLHVWLHDF